MTLVFPMIEPQMALQACTGYFLGGDDRYVAFLYSDRIVFRLLDEETCMPSNDVREDIVISIPQPPMSLGDIEKDILPNLGNLFCAVGRNKDMLAMQFKQSLVILSVNSVDNVLELQGCWGLSKVKDRGMHKASSAASLASYVEHPHVPKLRRPGMGTRNSSTSLLTMSSLTTKTSDNIDDSISRLNLTNTKRNTLNSMTGLQSPQESASPTKAAQPNSSATNVRSGLALHPEFARPQVSPDGTQVFLVTRNKYESIYLVLLSSFGQELIKMEAEYITVLTHGWISDDIVFIVYLNQNFHKKFQTFRLSNKKKPTGIFGMGRKHVKPSFSAEVNVPLAADFLPSAQSVCGGPNLVFKDYVLLGTRDGGYVRVNYRSCSWEPVLNAKNVVGAVPMDGIALVVQSSAGKDSPTRSEQLSYSTISESTVHALKADPAVGSMLCSKHNLVGDKRFLLKLIHLGNGVILDYKRQPFRAFKFSRGRNVAPLALLPWNGPAQVVNHNETIVNSAKTTEDFLVKTEMALYTRDANGDDTCFRKIINHETVISVPSGRPNLVRLLLRDVKSVWAVYTNPVEVRVLDESHSKPEKMRNRASYVFSNTYVSWKLHNVTTLSRNLLLVTLKNSQKWVMFLLNFVNSTHKTNATQPHATLVLESQHGESMPVLLRSPGNSYKLTIRINSVDQNTLKRQMRLYGSSSGQFRIENHESQTTPKVLDESENFSVFTEVDGPLEGMCLAGSVTAPTRPQSSGGTPPACASPGSPHTPLAISDARVSNILAVEAANVEEGTLVVIPHRDYTKSSLWLFDSDGMEFREFDVKEVSQQRISKLRHYEQQIKSQQSLPKAHPYHISPEFSSRLFVENSRNNWFRPLPEVKALFTRGIGSGIDAEVYMKSPDEGYYAIFRIQNRKLLDALSRLERVVLERRVGVWLPDELRKNWLNDFQGSTMISGSAFAAFWRLSEEIQTELCQEANVDLDVMKKIRPQ